MLLLWGGPRSENKAPLELALDPEGGDNYEADSNPEHVEDSTNVTLVDLVKIAVYHDDVVKVGERQLLGPHTDDERVATFNFECHDGDVHGDDNTSGLNG